MLVELRQEKREVRIETRLQRWREGVVWGPLEVKDISDGLAITANGGWGGLGSPQVSSFNDCWRQNAQGGAARMGVGLPALKSWGHPVGCPGGSWLHGPGALGRDWETTSVQTVMEAWEWTKLTGTGHVGVKRG